jgi:protein-S-isoprenylcysteine O-methyltransferase Ste14
LAGGLLPIAGGVAVAVVGERAFKRAGTAVLPSSALVTTGPFAVTRNPMYLGLVLCLLGWAVLLGSLVPFAVVPAFFALVHFRFVRHEEPSWPRGSARRSTPYKARVRRWL